MIPIIALSGSSQTGKTTLGRRLAEELDCRFASFGEYVRTVARCRGIVEPTRKELQDIGQALVEEDALGFCRAVLETVNFSTGDGLVLDGLRHTEVLEALRALSGSQPIAVIYLCAPIRVREARATGQRYGEALPAADQHKAEQQINREIRESADLIIDAAGEVEQGYSQIRGWLRCEYPDLVQLSKTDERS